MEQKSQENFFAHNQVTLSNPQPSIVINVVPVLAKHPQNLSKT